MMKFQLITTCVFIASFSHAQHAPKIFQPGIISNGGVFGFTLSPDGREAFWVQSNGGRDTLVIMHSLLVKKKWQKPLAATFSGKPGIWKDIDPLFSPDGKRILFQSNRSLSGDSAKTDFDIWQVDKTERGWGEPFPLTDINTDASESFASVAENGNLYFMKQNPDRKGSSDLYMAEWSEGQFKAPVNVGHPLNTPFRESNPFISPNEDYLIYFTDDSTGLGEVDLVISFRAKTGWRKPVSLGQPINTAIGEFCPFVHTRQKRIYFSRTEVKAGGRRVENIYSSAFDLRFYKRESELQNEGGAPD